MLAIFAYELSRTFQQLGQQGILTEPHIYIYLYTVYILFRKMEGDDVKLFFLGMFFWSQEFMQRNRSVDILVTALSHRTLS